MFCENWYFSEHFDEQNVQNNIIICNIMNDLTVMTWLN